LKRKGIITALIPVEIFVRLQNRNSLVARREIEAGERLGLGRAVFTSGSGSEKKLLWV
jgi:hypothetical protein